MTRRDTTGRVVRFERRMPGPRSVVRGAETESRMPTLVGARGQGVSEAASRRHRSPTEQAAAPTMSPKRMKRLLGIADVVALGLGVAIAFVVQHRVAPVQDTTAWGQALLAVVSVPIWLALAVAMNLYVTRAVARVVDEVRLLTMTALVWTVSVAGVAFAVDFDDVSRRWVITASVCVLASQIVERQVARNVFTRLRRSGRMPRVVLIAGTDANSRELADRLQRRPELGYRAVGFLSEPGAEHHQLSLPVLGDLRSTATVASEVGATGVMISLSAVDGPTVNQLARTLTDAGVHVTLCSSLSDIDINRLRFQQIDGQTLVYVEPVIRTGWRRIAKHVFDYSISIIGLLLAAPIIALAAAAIRIESPGPVFFSQRRVGQRWREFEILKFRTMVRNAEDLKQDLLAQNESTGPLFKIRADPRITRVGSVLGRLSIDELPQFWNVLCGDMSVCGPRPALPSEVMQWDADVYERLRVLPGITGIWQVSGRADTSFEEYKRLDVFYVDNWSLFHDLRIVLKTVGVVLSRRGAS